MERWSYKPEVEGLSPSLGTNRKAGRSRRQEQGFRSFVPAPAACLLLLLPVYRGVTQPARTLTVQVVEFEEADPASRPDQIRGMRDKG